MCSAPKYAQASRARTSQGTSFISEVARAFPRRGLHGRGAQAPPRDRCEPTSPRPRALPPRPHAAVTTPLSRPVGGNRATPRGPGSRAPLFERGPSPARANGRGAPRVSTPAVVDATEREGGRGGGAA